MNIFSIKAYRRRGRKWKKTKNIKVVYRIFNMPIYYGQFEYPRKSDNWYQGKHEPIVTKELFDKANQQLKRDVIVRESREFAFTKLMTCGLCGSGISAEEKYKKLKNGTVAKYIYYGCGMSKDRHCKNSYLREEELVEQLIKLIDEIDMNNVGLQIKSEEELKRINNFNKGVLEINNSNKKHKEINLKTYAKYVLRSCSNEEKRELMGCFKSKITITNGLIGL
jgi:site-specific DNA recombinase